MRRAGLAPLAAVLLALTSGAAAQPRPAPVAFAGIPNLEIEYYDVLGRTAPEIRAAINRHPRRPRDPNDGLAMDALANWYLNWSWPATAGGRCDLARARIRFRARVLLPRLVEEARVPAPVLARWRSYIAALETHEAGHIRFAYQRSGAVLAALRSSSCARANDDAAAAVATINRHDVDYDRATHHGATEGATFP